MPLAPQTEPPSKRTRTIPNGPLWCPELGRSLPLDLSIPQAAALVGRSERAMYRAKELDQLPGVAISGGEYRVGTTRLLAMYGLTVGPKPE
jgi:hypothetical protein